MVVPKLVVASQNPGKLREIQEYLRDLNWELVLMPAELEIEETGDTFLANACLKASKVAGVTGEWAIADDSGLAVQALDGAPGIYSARYGKTDAERIQRLLDAMENESNRRAEFVCVIALARPDRLIALHAQGICPGEILPGARGIGGFGYDPIFYVPEQGMTFAEMPAQIKHQISHRGRAFRAFLPQLQALKLDE